MYVHGVVGLANPPSPSCGTQPVRSRGRPRAAWSGGRPNRNVAEEHPEAGVVGTLERPGDDEGRAEADAERGAGTERRRGAGEGAGGVRVGGRSRAFAGVDDGDDVGLAGWGRPFGRGQSGRVGARSRWRGWGRKQRLPGGGWRGNSSSRRLHVGPTRRLYLRTNDDTPNNGSRREPGACFRCRVRVWR
jgi:hypothetical protein